MFDFINKLFRRKRYKTDIDKNCISSDCIKKLYIDFVRGYINTCEEPKINLVFDNIKYEKFLVVKENNTEIPCWFGSKARIIIVPKGIKVRYSYVGHNSLLILDGYKVCGDLGLYIYLYDIPNDILYSDKFQSILLDDVKKLCNDITNLYDKISNPGVKGTRYHSFLKKCILHTIKEIRNRLYYLRVDKIDDDINDIIKHIIEIVKQDDSDIDKKEDFVNLDRYFLKWCGR